LYVLIIVCSNNKYNNCSKIKVHFVIKQHVEMQFSLYNRYLMSSSNHSKTTRWLAAVLNTLSFGPWVVTHLVLRRVYLARLERYRQYCAWLLDLIVSPIVEHWVEIFTSGVAITSIELLTKLILLVCYFKWFNWFILVIIYEQRYLFTKL
jgi:hypothetical protein